MAVKPFVFFSDLEFFACFLPAIMTGSLSLTKNGLSISGPELRQSYRCSESCS